MKASMRISLLSTAYVLFTFHPPRALAPRGIPEVSS